MMAYVNMMPPELAKKYTEEKLWLEKTAFDILEERAAKHSRRASPSKTGAAPPPTGSSRIGSNARHNSTAR